MKSNITPIRCGIDLGGTKIEGVLILKDTEGFQVLERLRIPTEQHKGYQHVLSQICKLIAMLKQKCDTAFALDAIGIGTPGTLDPETGTLKNSNTVCLNGKTIKSDLEQRLGMKVYIANDANCFALAEATLGAVPKHAPNATMVFGTIMGTGVGGGLVINQNVWEGQHGIGGEWGHNFLDESGGPCYCGKVGCVETIISGTALESWYKAKSGCVKPLKTLVKDYRNLSDPIAVETIERLLNFFGKGIASIINMLDPDAIVLGGGLGNIDLLYTEGLEAVKKYMFNDKLHTKFLKPELGDSAGVFGAAMLVKQ